MGTGGGRVPRYIESREEAVKDRLIGNPHSQRYVRTEERPCLVMMRPRIAGSFSPHSLNRLMQPYGPMSERQALDTLVLCDGECILGCTPSRPPPLLFTGSVRDGPR